MILILHLQRVTETAGVETRLLYGVNENVFWGYNTKGYVDPEGWTAIYCSNTDGIEYHGQSKSIVIPLNDMRPSFVRGMITTLGVELEEADHSPWGHWAETIRGMIKRLNDFQKVLGK